MSILHAVILGAVQGICEFLPISSSGHLVLLQKIFGIEGHLFFDTMLHVGTLLAVVAVLWKDILPILKRPVQPLMGYLILGTVPAVIAALAFRGPIEKAFETGLFLSLGFLITSVLLIFAELMSKRRGKSLRNYGKMKTLDALVIGIMQAVAIIPGISRSGATISGALSRKLDRDFAARFSFLLSIPAILGALVLQSISLAKDGAAVNSSIQILPVIAGTITAAVVGFFAVRFMLKIIRERSLYGFAIYTAVLGIFILIDQFGTHLVF